MAQADGVVANGSGAAVRADINSQIAAAFTNHSGETPPATTFAYQFWADTSANQLKIRNSDNTAYSLFGTLDGRTSLPDGTDAAPSLFFSSDTNVGIRYDSAYTSLAFIRGGVKQSVFGRTLDGQTNAITFGPCARQTTTVNPTNGTNSNKDTVKGLSIQDDGPLHIGTADSKRPLTLNMMGSYGTNDANVTKHLNFNTNGIFRFGIEWNGSAGDFTLSSDYRLKENVVSLTSAIDRIKQARPVRFNFINNPDTTLDGFIAHEIGEVVPESICGAKDAVDENGDIEPQSVFLKMLVPLLTAALQESITKIEALETRVATLEAA
jgi:hypothetical protein